MVRPVWYATLRLPLGHHPQTWRSTFRQLEAVETRAQGSYSVLAAVSREAHSGASLGATIPPIASDIRRPSAPDCRHVPICPLPAPPPGPSRRDRDRRGRHRRRRDTGAGGRRLCDHGAERDPGVRAQRVHRVPDGVFLCGACGAVSALGRDVHVRSQGAVGRGGVRRGVDRLVRVGGGGGALRHGVRRLSRAVPGGAASGAGGCAAAMAERASGAGRLRPCRNRASTLGG